MSNVTHFAADASTLHGPVRRPGDIVLVDAGERSLYARIVSTIHDGVFVVDPVVPVRAIAAAPRE